MKGEQDTRSWSCPSQDDLQGRVRSQGGGVGGTILMETRTLRGQLRLCVGTEGPLLARLWLPSGSQPPWAPCCQQSPQSPALSQPNPTRPDPTDFLCRGCTDDVPVSVPAALHVPLALLGACREDPLRRTPRVVCPSDICPPRGLSSLLSGPVSATTPASRTSDAATASVVGGDAGGHIQTRI